MEKKRIKQKDVAKIQQLISYMALSC